MDEENKDLEDEISDLRHELEHFQKEKERVRAIVGKIGGVPKFQMKVANIIFIIIIAICLVIAIIGGQKWRIISIEFAMVALSLKIIYMIHRQTKIDHFKFWILSSLEWRINEMMNQIKKLEKQLDKD